MGITKIKFKRSFSNGNTNIVNALTAGNMTLAYGEPVWFKNSFYGSAKMFVGDDSGAPLFVGPYIAGDGITIDNTATSATVGQIAMQYPIPSLTGNGGKLLAANSAGTGLELVDHDILWVTFSKVEHSDGTMTCDKTYAEITAAIAAGRAVIAMYQPAVNNYPKQYFTLPTTENNNELLFANMTPNSANEVLFISMTSSACSLDIRKDYSIPDVANNDGKILYANSLGDAVYWGNLPTIPTVPTTVSSFTNDAGYITSADVPEEIFVCTFTANSSMYNCDKTAADIYNAYSQKKNVIAFCGNNIYYLSRAEEITGAYDLMFSAIYATHNPPESSIKILEYTNHEYIWRPSEHVLQLELSSSGEGQNIKTINNESLLGSGNISIIGLPTVTSSDNGKTAVVDNNEWTLSDEAPAYKSELEETNEVAAAALNNLNTRIEKAKNASNNLAFERLSVSGAQLTLQYDEDCKGYKSISTANDLSLTFKLANSGENYLLVENTSSENVSLDIGDIYLNNVKVSDVLKASDTVVLPVGMCYEISVVAFPDVAVVTISDSLRYSDWYGVEVDTTVLNPVLTRIGSTTLHKSVPIQAGMRRCLQNDDGTVNYYLDASDSTLKEDGTAAVLDGTDGQVMVEIQEHYCRIEAGGLFGTKQRVKLSLYPLDGFTRVPKSYISAFEAALDRTNNKLSSVINTTAQYRGGANDSDWDNTYRSQLGMPATNISLTNFRTYASNRGTHWTCQDINIYTQVCMLYLVEYANRNIQASFTSTLTAEGYHQGGLGIGVSKMENWSTYNSSRPVVPCGVTVSLGNATGVVTYNVIDSDGTTVKYAAQVPSYRGIENLLGHIWKHTDGILVNIDATTTSDVYVCTDNTKFSSTLTEDYVKVGEEARSSGFTKNVMLPYLIATEVGADSSTGWCDYHYTTLPSSGSSIRCVLFGGHADLGSSGGFAYAGSAAVPSIANAAAGSRLCYRA